MSEDPEDWNSQLFRQRIRNRIDETIRQTGNHTNKTVPELENHVYQKANSREEYLQYAARLIHYLKENHTAKKQHNGLQQGMISQTIPSTAPDPISSLQTLAGSQSSGDMQGVVPMNTPVSSLQDNSNMNVTSVSATPMTISVQGPSVPQMQQMAMNQSGHMAQRVGMSQNRMVVSQMLMPNAPNVQVPVSHANQRGPVMTSNIQMMQRMRQPTNQGPPNAGDQVFYQGGGQPTAMHPQQFQPNLPAQFQGNPGVMMPNQNPGMAAHHAPMTQLTGPQAMAPSPSSYIPSPSQGLMASPMSVGMINQRAPLSVPSAPSPSSLNTPVMVANQSPASRPVNDDQAYFDKVRQLSKYIEPLRKMITRIDRDESMSNERKKDLHKINNLLEIISDATRRVSMETLLKCEQVLERMEFKFKSDPPALSGGPQAGATLSKLQDHNIGQPLLEAVMNNIKKPFFNHTLHRTFGPAVAAMTNTSYRVPSPIPKQKKHDEHSDVPEVLQGEIARLDQRFKVQMDPLQHSGSKTISLICRLDDRELPCVPPISVIVPDSYPSKPPRCSPDDGDEYNASPFLQQIQKSFNSSINKLCNNYSITTLLNRWEMSVRQACAKEMT